MSNHWILAAICYPGGKCVRCDQEAKTVILLFNSWHMKDKSRLVIAKALRLYLAEECKAGKVVALQCTEERSFDHAHIPF